MKTHLTLGEGLLIQKDQIDQWSYILGARALILLKKEARKENAKMKSTGLPRDHSQKGYEVWRGTDMDNFLGNLALRLQSNGRKDEES